MFDDEDYGFDTDDDLDFGIVPNMYDFADDDDYAEDFGDDGNF